MKKLLLLLIVATIIISCKTEKNKRNNKLLTEKNAPISNAVLESAVIYEANIRQYSKEGTFNAFTKDIPQLKKLGVKIIWLMPIFPISETKRKATNDKFAHEFPENERKKYLGSYYAVSDFTKINPEFGTIEDFRKLVKTAHDNDMYVILDWVPNHTGWDHTWIKTHPEFYTKNEKGEITEPLNEDGTLVGWADVADLNYDNKELRKTMIADMSHWITNEHIDGFRCDVAGSVPTDFWKEAIPKLRQQKNVFMLAEAWEPELLKNNLFDMAYGWDRHHAMNAIAKGENSAILWQEQLKKDANRYEEDDILMNFVTNHDENSWNGTISERMGNASEALTALSYLTPGMPLIYSGQEYGLQHRLKFFEKDEIPHDKGKAWELLEKLGTLKNTSKALHGGKKAANYSTIDLKNNNVLAFSRSKDSAKVVYIANLSKDTVKIDNVFKENYLDYIKNTDFKENTDSLHLQPWDYKILIKK